MALASRRRMPAAQKKILDDIAFKDKVKVGLEKPAEFFGRMRSLTLGAYYTTSEGWAEIGYMGNTPGTGDYAGPTPGGADAHQGRHRGHGSDVHRAVERAPRTRTAGRDAQRSGLA